MKKLAITSLRTVKWLAIGLLILLLLSAGGLVAWVSTGPHSVSWVKDKFLQNLNSKPDLFNVKIEDVVVQFDGWDKPLGLHAINTTVLLPGGQLFTSVPDIDLSIDWLAMLSGEIALDEVRVVSPSLYLHRSDEGLIMIGNNEGDSTHTVPLSVLLGGVDMGEGSAPVTPDIFIEDATLRLYSETLGSSINVVEGYVALRAKQGGYTVNARLPVAYEERFAIKLSGDVSNEQLEYAFSLSFDDLPVPFVCALGEWCTSLGDVAGHFSGKLDVLQSPNEAEPKVAFDLKGNDLLITKAAWFEQPLAMNALNLRGRVDLAEQEVYLSNINGKTADFPFQADGQLQYGEEPPTFLLNATLNDLPINAIRNYWPIPAAANSRLWTIEHVRDGTVPEAAISMKITPEDHATEFFPTHILSADIKVQDAVVDAIKDAPPLRDVQGTVSFTGDSMKVVANSATLGKLALSELTLEMPDLNAPAVPTKTAFAFAGSVPHALELLEAKAFTFDDRFGLSKRAAKGAVEGNLSLEFDAFTDSSGDNVNWDSVRYDVSLGLKDIFYPNFMGKNDIGSFAGTLNANNAGVVIEGEGIVDGAKLSGRLESKARKATRYTLKGTVQANQFSRYGLQIEPYLQGPLGVDVSIVDGAIFPAVNATIDATRAEAHLEEVFWRKPRGTNMTIKLKANPDKASKRGIVDLDISAASMHAKGKLELDADSGELKQLKMDRVSFGENDVSVTYQPLHNGYFVEINGRSLDLRPHLAQESKQSISNFPPLHLVANVERVLLAHDEAFRGVKGKLFCTLERCHSADISGQMAEGETFNFNIIRSPADVRTLDVRADNAGRFLKAFDLVSAMQNGKLSITGEYDDAQKGNPLTGRFIIADFMLKDAPVLGRILNLGSLTGLVDSLTGQGMRFEKLAMDLIFTEDTATLKNAIMKGPSIGVTANGDIHIGDAMINVKGTVIPAYALNSLLGEIPILGDIITGGEGQGVLGVDYSVKGSYKEPEVSVNPLSAFTPGFLRNIFGVFNDDSSTSSDSDIPVPRQRRSAPAR